MNEYSIFAQNRDRLPICIDVWGDYAMFTRPESKVERTTYPVPTPSACRGILNAIYSKPVEFYYQVTSVDVMHPIHIITVTKNELKQVADNSKVVRNEDYRIDVAQQHTQRVSSYLTNVYYRIHAEIILRDDVDKSRINLQSIVNQFVRRVTNGKCFYQPYFGTRECICYFSEPDKSLTPIDEDLDIGTMLYDVFDLQNNKPLNTSKAKATRNMCTDVSFFEAKMRHGIVEIPTKY